MIVGCNQKLTVIFTYNDSGSASRTLILTCSISEKARDLLNTDGSNCHNRWHRCLCNACYRTAFCHNILYAGICGTIICTAVVCSVNGFCFFNLCTAAIFYEFISCNIHSLEYCTRNQSENHSQSHCCRCFFAKTVIPISTGCSGFLWFLGRYASSCIISCLRLMHFIMSVFRFFLSHTAILCVSGIALLHPSAC